MAFKDTRRQKFLDETHAKEFDEYLEERVQRESTKMHDASLVVAARSSYAWAAASNSLQLLILRYTAGQPVEELSNALPAVIAAFDNFMPFDIPQTPNEAHTLTITQHEAYVYVLWLLSLCHLLHHDELVPTVLGWLDRHAEFNRGRDGLFEFIVQKLTGTHVPTERVLLHGGAYKPLAKVTVAAPEEQPALMKEFLDNWYKNMKPCYWYGTHTDKQGSSYFGYWAFEAALVTVLWDIDDASYRDHLVYPKDLADWARTHFVAPFPQPGPEPEPPRKKSPAIENP